jgi:hypothetical protein
MNVSVLHLDSALFTSTKLTGLPQIPREQQDRFIEVIGAAEDLSPLEPRVWRLEPSASNADFHCS